MPNMFREGEMMRERFIRWSRTPRSRLLSAVVFLILFVLAVALENTVYALGWLCLLVATGLLHAAASDTVSRSGTLSYLSIGFQVLGFLLLVTGLFLNFS
jgi:apolipoprotein N-acyltransferase